MTAGVYMIRHRESGKCYIGSSYNLRKRLRQHRGQLRRSTHYSKYMQSAWNKYGCDAFDFSVLIICNPEMRLFYEQRCLDAMTPAYNTSPTAGGLTGNKIPPETRLRMAAAQRKWRKKYEWKGQKLALGDIADMEGVSHRTLISRVTNLKHSIERAVGEARRVGRYELEHDGRVQTIRQWASDLSIHPRRLQYRITEGYSIADVISRLGREEKAISFSELCRINGANLQTAKSRLKKGMSVMAAITTPANVRGVTGSYCNG